MNGYPRCAPVVLALGLSLLVGCDQKSDNFLESGQALFAKNEVAAAIVEFKNAASKDPQDPQARYFLGVAQQRVGDHQNAKSQLLRARELGLDPNLVQPAIAALLVDMGATDEVLTETDSLEKLTDAAARALVLASRGDAYLALGRAADAAKSYAAALEQNPTSAEARVGQARLALAANDRAQAARIVADVVAADPNSVSARFLEGGLLAAEKRYKEAVDRLDQVVAARPLDFRAYSGLVSALVKDGDIPGAERRFEQLRKRAPAAPPVRYLAALLAFQKGDLNAARDHIRLVLKDVPDNVMSLVLAAQIEQRLRNPVLAGQYAERAFGFAPDNPDVKQLLASIYAKTNRLAKASELLKDLVNDSAASASLLAIAGEVALAQRKGSTAVDLFSRVVAMNPPDVGAYRVRLGEALIAAGAFEKGVSELSLLREDPDHGLNAGIALVQGYLSRKDNDRARAVARELTVKFPKAAQAHLAIARVQLISGDLTDARKAFERAAELEPGSLDAARFLATLDARAGEFAAAKGRFKRVLDVDPRQEEASLLLVQLLKQMRAPADEVLGVLDAAIGADPSALQVRSLKAEYLLEIGRSKPAVEEAQAAIASFGDEPRLLYALARAQFAAGDYSGAHTTYGKLTAIDSKSPSAHLGQVQVYVSERNWRAASASAAKAVQIAPGYLPARLAAVEVAILGGQYAEARTGAQEMQKRWPKDVTGYLAESRALQMQKLDGLAEDALRRGLSASGSPVALTRLYGILKEQKRDSEAEAVADAWVARHPGDAIALSGLAEYRLVAKDYAGAEKWYRKLVQVRPDDALALNNLAWTLGKAKRPDAEAVAKQALSLAPESGPILDTVGGIYLESGKPQEALPYLKKAAEKMPETAAIQMKYARALAAVGRKEDARAALEAARRAATSEAILQEIAQFNRSL